MTKNSKADPKLSSRFADMLPKIVVAPTFAMVLVFVYGFVIWNA